MSLQLDYNLDLNQRLALVQSLPLNQYTPQQLEQLANYILYKDSQSQKQPSKYVAPKAQPHPNPTELTQQTSQYTKPKPKLHTENPIIQQYIQSIETIKNLINQQPENAWKLRKMKIEHQLDMGIVNSLLYPTMQSHPTYSPSPPIDIDYFVDITNSFHVSKIIQYYSQLRQSDDSKLWIEWLETIIDKTPMYDWQKHLLRRRIDGAKQITIGRELGEYFGKIVTPSTMSQTMRTIYRQIALTAEREIYAYYMRDYPPAWKVCRKCGEKKLVVFDFYKGKNICKQCGKGRKKNENS